MPDKPASASNSSIIDRLGKLLVLAGIWLVLQVLGAVVEYAVGFIFGSL